MLKIKKPTVGLPAVSCLFKIIQDRMKNRLIEFLEGNSLMDSDQHGFRVGRSVLSAGIELFESIIDLLNKGE